MAGRKSGSEVEGNGDERGVRVRVGHGPDSHRSAGGADEDMRRSWPTKRRDSWDGRVWVVDLPRKE